MSSVSSFEVYTFKRVSVLLPSFVLASRKDGAVVQYNDKLKLQVEMTDKYHELLLYNTRLLVFTH